MCGNQLWHEPLGLTKSRNDELNKKKHLTSCCAERCQRWWTDEMKWKVNLDARLEEGVEPFVGSGSRMDTGRAPKWPGLEID